MTLVLVSVLNSCTGSSSQHGGQGGLGDSPSTWAPIGSSTHSFPGGVTLDVPARAVTRGTTISVSAAPPDATTAAQAIGASIGKGLGNSNAGGPSLLGTPILIRSSAPLQRPVTLSVSAGAAHGSVVYLATFHQTRSL